MRKSKYDHFIDDMPDGFLYFESILRNGMVIDYVLLDVNRAFEQMSKMKTDKMIGKKLSELFACRELIGFDLSYLCGRVAESGDTVLFEYYSSFLEKWYSVYIYKKEIDSLSIVLRDISEIKNRTEKINILYESVKWFYETSEADVDYQWIADELLRLSKAMFVLVNVFDKDAMRVVTRGFSGLGAKVRKLIRILGYDITGKTWDVKEEDLAVMTSPKLVRIGRLHEFSLNRISDLAVGMTEKVLNLGDSYGIGIIYNEKILGSFLIIMPAGKRIESPEIVELFVNQLGIMLLRKKAEQNAREIGQEYSTVFNGSQDGMFLVNVGEHNRFTYHMINLGYEIDTGISNKKMVGATPRDIYGESMGRQIEDHYMDCLKAGKSITYEEELIISGKKKVWHTLLSPIISEGRTVQIVGSSRNITRLKEWEDEVARQRQLFKVTLHSIGDAVITTDIDYKIVLLNQSAEELTGWSQEEAGGKYLNEVMITVRERSRGLLDHPSNDQEKSTAELKVLEKRDGSKRVISSRETFIRDEAGNTLGVVIIFRDVTEDKKKDDELKYLGYHDKLTGLYNRTYFEDALTRLDQEAFLPVGIIMGDSNGLKMVNDIFGHEEGDRLLKQISTVFTDICGSDNIAARVGGDEFAVILPRTDPDQVNNILKDIKQMCDAKAAEPISLSVALGSSIKTDMKEDIRKIYKEAEDRMYNNKLMESKSIRSSIISSLKKTLEERTHETEAHAKRLRYISMRLGKMMQLYDNELDELSLLATLHDIGKIAIPDHILRKEGKLSEDEWKIMKSHCEIGYRISAASPELAHIANLILCHHERWDGTGYPQGLKGEEIPLLSRLIAVVDSYDAMTSDRPYHKAMDREAALRELKQCSATQFDPDIVVKFLQVISEINGSELNGSE